MSYLDNFPLHYDDDARTVHTLLRVINPDDASDTSEVLIDNLTTAIGVITDRELRVRQETIVAHEFGDAMPEILKRWREHTSGSMIETLLIECYGDPAILR